MTIPAGFYKINLNRVPEREALESMSKEALIYLVIDQGRRIQSLITDLNNSNIVYVHDPETEGNRFRLDPRELGYHNPETDAK
jgi:hypothetical protein